MLDKEVIHGDVARALSEDIGACDITANLIPESALGQAKIITREPMVVSGVPWVEHVFSTVDENIHIEWQAQDGDVLSEPCTLAHLTGSLRHILTAERTALNFLQTLSGVATQTHAYVQSIAHTKTRILDTRKTLPGLRYAEKYAVRCGGGLNHRFGLFDAVLIKENHIRACGSITHAVNAAKTRGLGDFIEVEVDNLDELKEALAAEPDRILLDNFNQAMLKKAVLLNQAKSISLEASGGITLENIHEYAETGIDYISVGAITKSIRAIDLSLLLEDA